MPHAHIYQKPLAIGLAEVGQFCSKSSAHAGSVVKSQQAETTRLPRRFFFNNHIAFQPWCQQYGLLKHSRASFVPEGVATPIDTPLCSVFQRHHWLGAFLHRADAESFGNHALSDATDVDKKKLGLLTWSLPSVDAYLLDVVSTASEQVSVADSLQEGEVIENQVLPVAQMQPSCQDDQLRQQQQHQQQEQQQQIQQTVDVQVEEQPQRPQVLAGSSPPIVPGGAPKPGGASSNLTLALTLRERESRIRDLERTCRTLNADNLELQKARAGALSEQEKVRELNVRLGRAVLQVREDLASKSRLVEQADAAASRATLRRSASGARLRSISVQTDDVIASSNRSDASTETQYTSTSDYDESSSSASAASVSSVDPICECNLPGSFGCALHRTFSQKLLLAHRSLRAKIRQTAPPGLELMSVSTPPGLDDIAGFGLMTCPPGLAFSDIYSARPDEDIAPPPGF